MTHMSELRQQMDGVLQRWCPEFSRRTETYEVQMMRALLQVNAYELDAKRSLAGERPIRTDYPLPLPKK
jgi:hypothetical protein